MSRMLIKNGIIVTLENPNRVLYGHAILIEDGRIRKILPRKSAMNFNARIIDARGKVVMPGFINSHMHFYSSFARGLTKAAPAQDFPSILRNLWWRLDRRLSLDDCYSSTLVAGLEAIRHGTTTVFDHHASPHAIKGSLGTIGRAVQELGLRACLCYEVSDRNGRKIAQQGIEENLRWIEECQDGNQDHLRALFGMHASFTIGQKTLRDCVEKAARLQTGFHIHCAEDLSDQQITQRKFKRSVVQRLADHGVLGPRSICAHAVHLSDQEWDLLADTGTAVVHNPQSNMNNGVGVMNLALATQKGVLVGLGTDAMTNNMREELRSAIWAQRLSSKNPNAAFGTAVDVLARSNQMIANRYFPGVGQIKEGWLADLICIDYIPPTAMNESNFPGHLVFGLSEAAVDTTIVGGKILMQSKKLTLMDEEEICSRSRQLSAALWKRF